MEPANAGRKRPVSVTRAPQRNPPRSESACATGWRGGGAHSVQRSENGRNSVDTADGARELAFALIYQEHRNDVEPE